MVNMNYEQGPSGFGKPLIDEATRHEIEAAFTEGDSLTGAMSQIQSSLESMDSDALVDLDSAEAKSLMRAQRYLLALDRQARESGEEPPEVTVVGP